MENDNTLFLDTMQGLLEAIAIEQGAIEMETIEGMPAETLRAISENKPSETVAMI